MRPFSAYLAICPLRRAVRTFRLMRSARFITTEEHLMLRHDRGLISLLLGRPEVNPTRHYLAVSGGKEDVVVSKIPVSMRWDQSS